MKIQPYLFFDGRCEEAIEFYRQALGAEVEMLRMKESPEGQPPDLPRGSEDKIMHATLRVQGQEILLSDGMARGAPSFQGFSLAIRVANAAEADRYFDALSAGGQVQMPLAETFWSPRYGMLTDRFGIAWMVMVDNG